MVAMNNLKYGCDKSKDFHVHFKKVEKNYWNLLKKNFINVNRRSTIWSRIESHFMALFYCYYCLKRRWEYKLLIFTTIQTEDIRTHQNKLARILGLTELLESSCKTGTFRLRDVARGPRI